MDRKSHTSFPTLVAWLSLGLCALLFCGNTVPALRESENLRATEFEVQRLRGEYEQLLMRARTAMPEDGDELDLQSLLVAIDRIGLTPNELLQAYPQ